MESYFENISQFKISRTWYAEIKLYFVVEIKLPEQHPHASLIFQTISLFSDFTSEWLLILLALALLIISVWFSGVHVVALFRFALGCKRSWKMKVACEKQYVKLDESCTLLRLPVLVPPALQCDQYRSEM